MSLHFKNMHDSDWNAQQAYVELAMTEFRTHALKRERLLKPIVEEPDWQIVASIDCDKLQLDACVFEHAILREDNMILTLRKKIMG